MYDINIATCLIADGYYLLRFADCRFYFVAKARTVHELYKAPPPGTPSGRGELIENIDNLIRTKRGSRLVLLGGIASLAVAAWLLAVLVRAQQPGQDFKVRG